MHRTRATGASRAKRVSVNEAQEAQLQVTTLIVSTKNGITYTLLAIVILFFLCVFLLKLFSFMQKIKRPEYKGIFKFMIHFVNLLQAINFSANFVLYCLVNSYFRKTLRQGALFICRKCFRYKLDDDTDSPLRSEWSSKSSRVSTKSSTCV